MLLIVVGSNVCLVGVDGEGKEDTHEAMRAACVGPDLLNMDKALISW
jgi:hypothetical protein